MNENKPTPCAPIVQTVATVCDCGENGEWSTVGFEGDEIELTSWCKDCKKYFNKYISQRIIKS